MARTLRDLLIQRAARLQERPALTAPEWGTLSYAQLRNRAEGVAFALLAGPSTPEAVFSSTGTAWDWAAELATAASGLAWDADGWILPAACLGGAAFHPEAGRGPYHAREQVVREETSFHAGLVQGEVLRRLGRLNARLGWDHDTEVRLPMDRLGAPEVRAALWSALFGGSHAHLEAPRPAHRKPPEAAWTPERFKGFWDRPFPLDI
ncbi:MAG TPA: hypothetical protein VF768_04915, partial [Holophagaceae bacterium]